MSAGARFVTLEGIEGSGKSTVAAALVARAQALGVKVLGTREPGGSPLAERLRAIVLEHGEERLTPVAETLLMFAARAIHLESRIRPALVRGDWVVCDRFSDATRAYQGGGRGVDMAWIESLVASVHGDLNPARTLLLDLDPRLGLERARARRAPADRFEIEAVAFFERVRAAYLDIARREPARVRVLDASRPLEDVVAAAEQAAFDD